MKKTLLIFVFITSIVLAQDTTNTQIHFKDTLITKSVDNNHKDIVTVLIQLLPFIISLGGILIALYTVHNQKKIAQAQITANVIIKWIDDVIKEAAEIQTLFEKSYAFSIMKSGIKVFPDVDPEIYKTDVAQIDLHAYRLGMYLSPNNENEVKVSNMISDLCQKLLPFRDLCDDKNKIKEIAIEAHNINIIISSLEKELQILIEEKRKLINTLLKRTT